MSTTVHIVRPSSREAQDLLGPRIEELRSRGFEVRFSDTDPDPLWTYAAGTPSARVAKLERAILEVDSAVVWAARGGYGASDLLPLLDWDALKRAGEKLVVGFSDVSALHAALYARLGWRGLHAPMPATVLWRQNSDSDIERLIFLLNQWSGGLEISGHLQLIPVSDPPTQSLQGVLFGGCFSVLSSLLGTPYFPTSLAGHLVFFEDVDESPPRLMRALNQWLQSGVLRGVQAVVIGHLKDLGPKIPDCAPYVLQEFARRLHPIPVFHTPQFGHVSPNLPLMIGAHGIIDLSGLTWAAAPHTQETYA